VRERFLSHLRAKELLFCKNECLVHARHRRNKFVLGLRPKEILAESAYVHFLETVLKHCFHPCYLLGEECVKSGVK
jgi:hypothetical protein